MKKALKDFWRHITHFWYPAFVMMWAADSYVTGLRDEKWLGIVFGFTLSLCGLCLFYDESEKIRKIEGGTENDKGGDN